MHTAVLAAHCAMVYYYAVHNINFYTIKRIACMDSDQGLQHITLESHGQYHRITVVLQ